MILEILGRELPPQQFKWKVKFPNDLWPTTASQEIWKNSPIYIKEVLCMLWQSVPIVCASSRHKQPNVISPSVRPQWIRRPLSTINKHIISISSKQESLGIDPSHPSWNKDLPWNNDKYHISLKFQLLLSKSSSICQLICSSLKNWCCRHWQDNYNFSPSNLCPSLS